MASKTVQKLELRRQVDELVGEIYDQMEPSRRKDYCQLLAGRLSGKMSISDIEAWIDTMRWKLKRDKEQ